MKFNIISGIYLNRKQKAKIFAKWLLYSFSLIMVFMIMTSGLFDRWQPFSVIPLAMAVAMHEGELNSSIFAVFCGLFMDIATGNIFGFSALILLPVAMLTALITRNYIRVNLLNHLWITAVACLIIGSFEFLFEYIIWDYDGYEIILRQYFIPSYVSSGVVAPIFFLLIKYISNSFPIKDSTINSDDSGEQEDEERYDR